MSTTPDATRLRRTLTYAGARVATHDWFDLIKDDPPLREGIVHRDRLVVFGGGVPIRVDGEVVGSVGVSGGSAAQDREIAEAGAAALSPPAGTGERGPA